MQNALQELVRYLWKLIRWLQDRLGDSELRTAILEELGLDSTAAAPPPPDSTDVAAIEAYLASDDPDVLAFGAVADSIAAVFDGFETYFTPLLSGSGSTMSARDVFYLVLQLGAIDVARREAPRAYALARAAGFIDELVAAHEIPKVVFDPVPVLGPLETEEDAVASGDRLFLIAFALWFFLPWLAKRGLFPELEFDVLGGWDFAEPPDPNDPAELGDSLTSRAVSWAARRSVEGDTAEGDAQFSLLSTLIAIPKDHGGPGVFASFGGQIAVASERGADKIKASVTLPEGLSFFIGGESGTLASGSAAASADFEYVRRSIGDVPALALPARTGSRLEVGGLGLGFSAGMDRAIVKLILDRCALALSADSPDDSPDDFLAAVFPAGGLRADFNLTVGYDFIAQSVFLGGSAKLEVVIPIGQSIGPVTILHATVAFAEGEAGAREFTVRLSLKLELGALTAVADQIGFGISFPVNEAAGRLGFLDHPSFPFLPPKGIGLTVNGSTVSGGGFLFFDPDNDEYAGVLALDFCGYSLKTIGLIKTNLDEAPGFSLLLIGSIEGLKISLFAGGFLTGIGVVFGMHRTMSVEALQAGIKNRTLDAILFPEDPVANAPQLLAALKAVFPPVGDQWVLGITLQASWIDKNIVRIEAAVLVEWDSPTRIVLLGQAKLTLPTSKWGVVQVNFDTIGVLDFTDKRLSIDGALYSSRIGTFPLSGGVAVRANWGDDPDGAGAIGGLHPQFPLPTGFPKLDRLAVTIGKGDNPRIRGLCYIGVTSNTFQFGVAAELYAGAGGFSVEGDISLDLLFEFDPFRFVAELSFKAAVKYRGHTLAGLKVTGSLEGPGPWKAEGKVRIKILFIKVTKHFGPTTWGDVVEAVVEALDVSAPLAAALASPNNWTGQIAAARSCVTLRDRPAGDFVDVHPLAPLEVRQRVAPLGVAMDKFKNSPIAGDRLFEITAATLNGVEVHAEPVRDYFAPGQHLNVQGDAAISQPSFEKFQAGVRLSSAVGIHGTAVTTNFEYEEIVLNERMTRPSFFDVYRISAGSMLAAAEHGAVANGGRLGGNRYTGPARPVQRADAGFVAASLDTLAVEPSVESPPSGGATYTEVLQAIERRATGRPGVRRNIQIVRKHEAKVA